MALLLSDEDFPRGVVLLLRAWGHDVVTALDEGLANRGTADRMLLQHAVQFGRAVLTHNRKDFLRLHRELPSHAGILICTRDDDRQRLARHVHGALEGTADLHGVLLRVTRGGHSAFAPRQEVQVSADPPERDVAE